MAERELGEPQRKFSDTFRAVSIFEAKMANKITILQRVGGAILLAESQWNPKTAKESKEAVMARAALEALYDMPDEMVVAIGEHVVKTGEEPASIREAWGIMFDAALNGQ